MVKKNDTPALILALLVTLGLMGGAAWFLSQLVPGTPVTGVNLPKPPGTAAKGKHKGNETARFSSGEQILISTAMTPQKQAGSEAYERADYALAAEEFSASLAQNRNDPEALIYQQNAIAAESPNLTIGASLPIGTSENEALEIMRGIAQAQTEINRTGGIKGQKLLVALADDRNDPTIAQQVAQSFSQEERVLGVVGSFGSSTTLATLNPYQDANLVHISPTSTSVKLSGASPYFFRTVPSDYIAARSLAEYALDTLQRQKAVVYFNSQSDYSKSLKGEFSTALASRGGRIVSEVDLSQSDFSASQSLATAKAQQADVIALFANKATREPALAVINKNRRQLPILGGDSIYSATTLEAAGANSQGMIVAIPWHIEASPDASFPARSRELWYATVNWRTALSYDAVQTLAEALSRSDQTRQGLQETLSAPSFQAQGASGELYFLPSGDRNGSIQLVTVEQGNGPGGYIFTPVQ